MHNHTENAAFWVTLKEYYEQNKPEHPDVLLGDFNLIENPLDRMPVRDDPEAPKESLSELLTELQLKDGW